MSKRKHSDLTHKMSIPITKVIPEVLSWYYWKNGDHQKRDLERWVVGKEQWFTGLLCLQRSRYPPRSRKLVMEFVGEWRVVDLDVRNNDGVTALNEASERGKPECFKLLIDAGADLNVRTKKGNTALYWASREGHTACVKLLKDAGATE